MVFKNSSISVIASFTVSSNSSKLIIVILNSYSSFSSPLLYIFILYVPFSKNFILELSIIYLPVTSNIISSSFNVAVLLIPLTLLIVGLAILTTDPSVNSKLKLAKLIFSLTT